MKQALNTYCQEGVSIKAVDRIGDNHFLEQKKATCIRRISIGLWYWTGYKVNRCAALGVLQSERSTKLQKNTSNTQVTKMKCPMQATPARLSILQQWNLSEKLHIYRSICKSSTNKQEKNLANWQLKWVYLQDLKYKANHIFRPYFLFVAVWYKWGRYWGHKRK